MGGPPAASAAWRSHLSGLKRLPGKHRLIKPKLPLVLADHVSNRRRKLGEASCITEMALMMACWKANEFSDSACAKEIKAFFECTAKAEAKRKEANPEESLGSLDSQQANKLLGRFPNITEFY